MRVIATQEFSERANEFLESLARGDEPICVTEGGDAKAVFLGMCEWERIQSALATMEERADSGSLTSLRQALDDIENGRLSLHEDVVRTYREAHPV